MFKYYEVEIDGVDKTGKDLLTSYLALLSNHRFSINTRGIITQIAYSRKYNRNYEYNLSSLSKNKIIILLTAEVEDLKVRCKITNEKEFSIKEDLKLFDDIANELLSQGFKVYKFNTSFETPYEIIKRVISLIDCLEILEAVNE